MFSAWAAGPAGRRNRIGMKVMGAGGGERWFWLWVSFIEVPPWEPDRGILLKGTQVSGAGGRGLKTVGCERDAVGEAHRGSTSKEGEEGGRRAARETEAQAGRWKKWGRESFREKQPMGELNTAPGPNCVSIQQY